MELDDFFFMYCEIENEEKRIDGREIEGKGREGQESYRMEMDDFFSFLVLWDRKRREREGMVGKEKGKEEKEKVLFVLFCEKRMRKRLAKN